MPYTATTEHQIITTDWDLGSESIAHLAITWEIEEGSRGFFDRNTGDAEPPYGPSAEPVRIEVRSEGKWKTLSQAEIGLLDTLLGDHFWELAEQVALKD